MIFSVGNKDTLSDLIQEFSLAQVGLTSLSLALLRLYCHDFAIVTTIAREGERAKETD